MSTFIPRTARIGVFLFTLALFLGASHAGVVALGLSPDGAVRQAWALATAGEHGSYRFTSDIEQALVPRARPELSLTPLAGQFWGEIKMV